MKQIQSGNQPLFSQAYWVVPGKLLAGCYPGAPHSDEMTEKLTNLVELNISTVINLMEPDEVDHFGRPFISYDMELKALAIEKGRDMDIIRLPIRDLSIPEKGHMRRILDAIDQAIDHLGVAYVHCWGGRGRTGTVVGCYLIRHGLADKENVLSMIARLRSEGRNVTGPSPETSEQRAMVLSWEREKQGLTRADRLKGGVLGHAVGDALGVPVEFISREALKKQPVSGMQGYGTHHQPPGTWSDDTSLMLCLLEAIAEGLDLTILKQKFIAWRDEGYWTAHGNVFDIGIATHRAISRLSVGIRPLEAGGDSERSNGNGSLMRILPVSFLHRLEDRELVGLAEQVSCLTHRHLRSQMACGMFVLLARNFLNGLEPATAYQKAAQAIQEIYSNAPYKAELKHFKRFLSGNIADLKEKDIQSSGYVVHTLEAAVWCLLTSRDYSATVLKAVNLGDDTDTTAAVAGGLAGITYGTAGIPEKWLDGLARREDILQLADKALGCVEE